MIIFFKPYKGDIRKFNLALGKGFDSAQPDIYFNYTYNLYLVSYKLNLQLNLNELNIAYMVNEIYVETFLIIQFQNPLKV